MLWFALALSCAVFASLHGLALKRAVATLDEYIVSWGFRAASVLLLLPPLLFQGMPTLDATFWACVGIGAPLNLAMTVLMVKAVKHSDLGVVMPLTAFTPIFLVLFSPLIVGEFPSALGLGGIALVTFGSYAMNLREWRTGLLAPLAALRRDRGAKLMIYSAIISAITSNIDKVGVAHSSVLAWSLMVNLFITLALLPSVIRRWPSGRVNVRAAALPTLAAALSGVLLMVAQFWAITLTMVAYVVAVKRTSALISVLLGRWAFGERDTRNRLIGAAIMVAGVIVIALS